MLDLNLQENPYIREPTMQEKTTAQSDSKVILSTYDNASESAGRLKYFIVDKYCIFYGEHQGWDKFRIHLAFLQVNQDLILMEKESILSDAEDYFEEYKDTVKKPLLQRLLQRHLTKRKN